MAMAMVLRGAASGRGMRVGEARATRWQRGMRRPVVRWASGVAHDSEDVVKESFDTPFWRNVFLGTLLFIGVYRLAPQRPKTSIDASDPHQPAAPPTAEGAAAAPEAPSLKDAALNLAKGQGGSVFETRAGKGSGYAVGALGADDEMQGKPWLTRYIAYHMPKEETSREREERHLELAKEAAETRLVIQSAVRPVIARMRFPMKFEQASPFNISPGSQADLSDLHVKTERD